MDNKALAFAFLAACALSFGITPALVSYSEVEVEERGTVSVSPGVYYQLDMNLTAPSSTSYQKVKMPQSPKMDEEGNYYLAISSSGPKSKFSYSEKFLVQSSARTTPFLPGSYSVPKGLEKYLLPSNRTQSSDPAIKEAALSAIASANSPFEKVANLAIFTNRLISYDASEGGQKRDALWVLQNKRGVCVEYATLFVALCRSVGIPARYVNGYVYSEQFGSWMGHSWAEAYIGEWVPVDPTWLEVGHLDAMHIESGKYAELSSSYSFSATVSLPSSRIIWEPAGGSGAAASNIATKQMLFSEPYSNYSLSISSQTLGLGESASAFLRIKGSDYRVIPVTLSSCTGEGALEVQNPTQYAILSPQKEVVLEWKITAPAMLDARYIYSCPLSINSPYLSHKAISVKIDPSKKPLPSSQKQKISNESSSPKNKTGTSSSQFGIGSYSNQPGNEASNGSFARQNKASIPNSSSQPSLPIKPTAPAQPQPCPLFLLLAAIVFLSLPFKI